MEPLIDPLTDPLGVPRALPGEALWTSPMFPVALNGLVGLACGLAALAAMFYAVAYSTSARPAARVVVAAPRPRDWVADAEALAAEVRAHRDYRRGAHDLDRLMESWSEVRVGGTLDALTVDEISARLSSGEVAFWRRVRSAAFGAVAPGRGEFEDLCATFRVQVCGPPAARAGGRAP
jgi:hypothetical protein